MVYWKAKPKPACEACAKCVFLLIFFLTRALGAAIKSPTPWATTSWVNRSVEQRKAGGGGVAFPVKIIIVSPRPRKKLKESADQTEESSPNWANKLMNPSLEWILELATTRRGGAGRGRRVCGCGCGWGWDWVLVVQLVWAWARAQNRTEANRTESVAWILWKWSKFHFIATTKAKANKKLSSTAFRVWSAGCYSSSPGLLCSCLVFSAAPLSSLLLSATLFFCLVCPASSWSAFLLSSALHCFCLLSASPISSLLLPAPLSFCLVCHAPLYLLWFSSLPLLTPLLSGARLAALAPFSRLLGHDLDRLSIILEAASQCPLVSSRLALHNCSGRQGPLPPSLLHLLCLLLELHTTPVAYFHLNETNWEWVALG